ncbi:MAG TPA: hypothetical protein VKG91_07665 [Roseiarcus sp.]|nr:hypothetical protein [Roseiarcus sp.]
MEEEHPEQPDRLRAIERALESEVFQMLARDVAPRAEISAIERVHPLDYIERRCHTNPELRREVRKSQLGLMLRSRLATSETLRL